MELGLLAQVVSWGIEVLDMFKLLIKLWDLVALKLKFLN